MSPFCPQSLTRVVHSLISFSTCPHSVPNHLHELFITWCHLQRVPILSPITYTSCSWPARWLCSRLCSSRCLQPLPSEYISFQCSSPNNTTLTIRTYIHTYSELPKTEMFEFIVDIMSCHCHNLTTVVGIITCTST